MKYFLLAFAIPALMNNQCRKKRPDGIPACIWQKIEAIKGEPKWNPPAEVNEYIYKGKPVFLFSSNCCDQYNMLYDDNCEAVCAPSGGYTGKGDSRCLDFNETAKHVKLVWKDER